MIIQLWQGNRVQGRCPECGHPLSHKYVDDAKEIIRVHLRQVHGITAEPQWKGP